MAKSEIENVKVELALMFLIISKIKAILNYINISCLMHASNSVS